MDIGFNAEDKRWKSGIFRRSKLNLISSILVTLVMILISSKILTTGKDAYGPFSHWKNLTGVFHVFTLTSLVWMVQVILQTLKFRGSKFIMGDMPGVIGGVFKGVLVLPNTFKDGSRIKVEIVNLKVARRVNDKDGGPKTKRFYSERKIIPVSNGEVSGRQIMIPVEFTIPFSAKDETDNGKETTIFGDFDISYKWIFNAQAVIKGADLDVKFEVPVYRTSESNPDVNEPTMTAGEIETEMYYNNEARRVQVILKTGCKRYITRGGLSQLTFSHYFTGLFGLCLLGFGVFCLERGIRCFYEVDGKIALLLLAIVQFVFHLAGTLVVWFFGVIGVFAFLDRLSKRETWVEFGYLCQKRSFFLYSRNQKIEIERVQDVVFEKYSSNEIYEAYRVFIEHKSGLSVLRRKDPDNKRIYVVDDIRSKAEVLWLKEELLNDIIEKL